MKIIRKYREGDAITSDAVFLKSKTKVKRHYSNHTWCGCPDILNCDCYKQEEYEEFYYEFELENDAGFRCFADSSNNTHQDKQNNILNVDLYLKLK